MIKTSVKFQNNLNKTVGGVAHKRYILLKGDGRTEGRKDGKPDNSMYVPPLFFEKAGDNIKRKGRVRQHLKSVAKCQ